MGYTHYWYMTDKGTARDFGATVAEMAAVIRNTEIPLAGPLGEGEPELGPDCISFNGCKPDDYETFTFVPFGHGQASPSDEGKDFAFCKTGVRPYDPVVCACLAIAAENLGDGIEVSSDGVTEDWAEGVALASRVLGREVPNPIEPR